MLRIVKSVADMNAAIVANLHRVPRDIDAVVGIPRSGMLAASALALHLQKPLADVEGFGRGQVYKRSRALAKGVRRILLCDDTVLYGTAMAAAVKRVHEFQPKAMIVRMAVYDSPSTPDGAVDLACERVPGPRAFAWNLWKHKRMPRWCFDFDGVLCRDPNRSERSDPAKYLRFIRTVEPRFCPTRPIGWIVTGRMETYRAETEAWLKRHGIEYLGLSMLPVPPDGERPNRAGFKARIYQELGTKYAELFIESDPRQAVKIAALTGKAVWCVDNQAFYPAAVPVVDDGEVE